MVRFFSPERASVKIDRDLNTETTIFKTETSWSVGMWCQFLQLLAKAALIACCSSVILSIIWNIDTQLIVTSDINLCRSSPSWICFSHKSQCFSKKLPPKSDICLKLSVPFPIEWFYWHQGPNCVQNNWALNSEGCHKVWSIICCCTYRISWIKFWVSQNFLNCIRISVVI